MKAIVVHEPGGPEQLVYQDAATPAPQAGEALVKLAAIGINYIDVYHRSGLYPLPRPFIPGSEATGMVEAVGEGVTDVKVGDRVAYAMHAGAYAEYAAVPAWKLVNVPAEITFEQAAATMLQGMTAHYLVTSVHQLKAGETALIHAAAGGVGLLLIQLAKRLGARVIGTVSTFQYSDWLKSIAVLRAAGSPAKYDQIILENIAVADGDPRKAIAFLSNSESDSFILSQRGTPAYAQLLARLDAHAHDPASSATIRDLVRMIHHRTDVLSK